MIGHKTMVSSSLLLVLGAGLAVAGCGIFGGDDDGGGGSGDNGGGTAGSGGMATGGSVSGTAGTGPTGGVSGTVSTGGTVSGGTGGQGGSGGAAGGTGGSGGGTAGPFACPTPAAANCNSIADFPMSSAQTFGSGDFSGGVSIFPSGMPTTIMRDTDATRLHVTGMVSGYGVGFNIWFTNCSTLAAHTGVQFTISGTTTDAMAANKIQFQLQTNTDYPWEPFMTMPNGKGNCTAPAGMDPWGYCIAPSIDVDLMTTAQSVTWAMMMGGGPTPWNATMSPTELVGIQWQFPWSEGRMPYTFDVTLDDVSFTGGTAMACPAYMSGGGGMGGGSGAGGAGSGGMAGSGAGSGGMAGSGAGSGGMAGMGGMGGMGGT